jgi:hypothetical protein
MEGGDRRESKTVHVLRLHTANQITIWVCKEYCNPPKYAEDIYLFSSIYLLYFFFPFYVPFPEIVTGIFH